MSKDIKKALEHCVEWKCDNCPSGDDLGSGEIVCRGRLLPQVLEYVTDLESKLAENITLLEGLRKSEEEKKDMAMKRVYELKQQLKEKEKKIDKLEDKLHHYYEETLNKGTCGLCEHLRGEYKTDFAIEQLEKVKEFFLEEHRDEEMDTDYIITKDASQIADYLLDQIKKLKEGK